MKAKLKKSNNKKMGFKSNFKAFNNVELWMGLGRAFQRLGAADWKCVITKHQTGLCMGCY